MRILIAPLFVVGLAIAVVPTSTCRGASIAAQEKEKVDKRDAQAKEVAERFLKTLMTGGNIEAVMKTVDVPFFIAAERMKGQIIKDREQAQEILDMPPGAAKHEYKQLAIYSFASLPEKFFSEHELKLLKEILQKTDRIVVFRSARIMAIAVRIQEGEAKVVGFRSHLSPLSLALAAQERDKGDQRAVEARKIATETAQEFLQAAKAGDLDSLVKLADTPFYRDGPIVKDPKDLRNSLKADWGDFGKSERFPSGFMGAIKFADFGEPYPGERGAREPAAKIVGNDGWVVFIGQKMSPNVSMLLIRIRAGKGKVVGSTG